jgi:hypothetical protein
LNRFLTQDAEIVPDSRPSVDKLLTSWLVNHVRFDAIPDA